jgi:putative PIN family toxin of toxin-antitoxin system
MLRVVVDTNLWISFLIGRRLTVLKELFTRGDLRLLSSSAQLAELGDVASRPKFRMHFTEVQAEELMNLLYASSELVECTKKVKACRDEEDDFLLEIAVNGHDDILITGDADHLILHPFRGVEIMSHADFDRRIASNPDGPFKPEFQCDRGQ